MRKLTAVLIGFLMITVFREGFYPAKAWAQGYCTALSGGSCSKSCDPGYSCPNCETTCIIPPTNTPSPTSEPFPTIKPSYTPTPNPTKTPTPTPSPTPAVCAGGRCNPSVCTAKGGSCQYAVGINIYANLGYNPQGCFPQGCSSPDNAGVYDACIGDFGTEKCDSGWYCGYTDTCAGASACDPNDTQNCWTEDINKSSYFCGDGNCPDCYIRTQRVYCVGLGDPQCASKNDPNCGHCGDSCIHCSDYNCDPAYVPNCSLTCQGGTPRPGTPPQETPALPTLTPTPTPGPYTINGFKVKMPGNLAVEPFASQIITLDAGPTASQDNPYVFSNLLGWHTVSAPSLSGSSLGYTLCYNDWSCHYTTPTPAGTATIDPNLAYNSSTNIADLWWHYTPLIPNCKNLTAPSSVFVNDTVTISADYEDSNGPVTSVGMVVEDDPLTCDFEPFDEIRAGGPGNTEQCWTENIQSSSYACGGTPRQGVDPEGVVCYNVFDEIHRIFASE